MEKNNSYVYIHIRDDTNEIFYVGIGNAPNFARSRATCNRNIFWKRIVKVTTYTIKIVFQNLISDKAKLKEIRLIKLFGRKDLKLGNLCNLTDGGEGQFNASLAFRKRISEVHMNSKRTSKSKLKMSLSHIGKKQSAEHTKNMIIGKYIPILQYSKDDIFIKEWNSIKEAALVLNLFTTGICVVCKGRLKTCGGFKWKYKISNKSIKQSNQLINN